MRLVAVILLISSTAMAQSDGGSIIDCQNVPTYFPRGDHWATTPQADGTPTPIYYLQCKDGSPDITDGTDLDAVYNAFATWMNVQCPGGYPDVLVLDGGDNYPTHDRGDQYDAQGNLVSVQNIIYWVDDASAWAADSSTVALTTNLYLPSTGVDITSDMEFNGINYHWRAKKADGTRVGCTYGNADCFDVGSVALHEAGHFLGFNHVGCADAVMFPSGTGTQERTQLSVNETTGLCHLYPPRPASLATARWEGERCTDNSQCPEGLCIDPLGPASGWGWCTRSCDCTDGCTNNCPQAFICAHLADGTPFCKPGVHLTGGATTGGCACDAGAGCTAGCACDPDCVTCGTSGDCSGGRVCISGQCTTCSTSSQCTGGQVCSGGACTNCTSSDQCSGSLICKAGHCSPCTGNSDCIGGQVCSGGACTDCTSSPQCSSGQVCSGGRCGACSTSCPGGQVCISGSCRDCTSNSQCTGGMVCTGGVCSACTSSDQCDGGQVCKAGGCTPCTGTSDCPTGFLCAAGQCTGCTSTVQCAGGQVCVGGSCTACTADSQCLAGGACQSGRCTTASQGGGTTGGGSVDPTTGQSLDLCAPCTNGDQCASGMCVGDGTTYLCTQGCIDGALPGGATPTQSCPVGFDCVSASGGTYVCWPQDPSNCNHTGTGAAIDDVCYEANDPSTTSDDWYAPCGAGLVCFGFEQRCQGQEGDCMLYCSTDQPCPDPNQTCCASVDANGNCVGLDASAGRTQGGCFEIRQEGQSCASAEQSICGAGLGCFTFGDLASSTCYQRCDSATCPSGTSCTSATDKCGAGFNLCCASADLPGSCDPTPPTTPLLDLGQTCTKSADCASQDCLKHGSVSACTRTCNAVTQTGCPGADYDINGDGIPDGGFTCLAGASSTDPGHCWPKGGPLASSTPIDQPAPPQTTAPPPPHGVCGCEAEEPSGLLFTWALWLPLLGWRWRRRRRVL